MENYIDYCHREKYLFENVNKRFHTDHQLGAFDFFFIIIWKANRVKSYIATKLLLKGSDLNKQVTNLTKQIYNADSRREKMQVLIEEWKFGIPMASAILTVLYPDEFTIYDIRVCESLGKHQHIAHLSKFDKIWNDYELFLQDVKRNTPKNLSLRDKDHYLWGESFYKSLLNDINSNFKKNK